MARSKQSSIRKILTSNVVDVARALGQCNVVGDVVIANISSAGVEIGTGNVCRIEVGAADTYVAFGDSAIAAVTSGTSPGLKLKANEIYFVLATDDFIRASAAVLRLEVIVT